jgi:hypothetical protein
MLGRAFHAVSGEAAQQARKNTLCAGVPMAGALDGIVEAKACM